MNLCPGQIFSYSQQEFQQVVNPFSNVGNLLGGMTGIGGMYYQPICKNVVPFVQHVYQPPVAQKEPEVKEPKVNSAMKFIEQLAVQDKSNHPLGSKIQSEEKLLTAADLCHF